MYRPSVPSGENAPMGAKSFAQCHQPFAKTDSRYFGRVLLSLTLSGVQAFSLSSEEHG